MHSSINLQRRLLHFAPHLPLCLFFYCRPDRLLCFLSYHRWYSAHGRPPALYPLGRMDGTNHRHQRAILWGGTRGLREVFPHLTSTYILRDIARCRPLCSTPHVCEIKGPEYWTESRSIAPRQTFVVLTERQRHAHRGRPLMTGLTRGLSSFPITSQSHPTSPDCSCMASLYMVTPSQSFPSLGLSTIYTFSRTPLSA
jgi:hypothetical protein